MESQEKRLRNFSSPDHFITVGGRVEKDRVDSGEVCLRVKRSGRWLRAADAGKCFSSVERPRDKSADSVEKLLTVALFW